MTSEENSSIPLLNALLFPYNSSHSESSPSVNLQETSRPLTSIEELGGPVRGDLSGVSREDSHESLSNDIKILGNFDEFDNKIQQNDQAFGCNIKPKFSYLNKTKTSKIKPEDDREMIKLENLILKAKETVLKFQKQIQNDEKRRTIENKTNLNE